MRFVKDSDAVVCQLFAGLQKTKAAHALARNRKFIVKQIDSEA
jgi:hypothetical protein